MDLHRLHQFLAVVEHGSIGRAAQTLNLSQPALSNSIRRLEDNLEARLFDRGPHGVTPTVFGEALAERVRLIFHEVRNAEQELAALRGVHTGHVFVGAGPSIVADILPAAIMNLQRKRQGVRVTVREGMMDNQLDALARAEIDLTIGAFPDTVPDLPVEREPLFVDSMVVIARSDHPLGDGRSRLKDLLAFPWVISGTPETVRDALSAAFVEADLELPTARVETNSVQFMKRAVATSDALSFMPERLIEPEASLGALITIPVREKSWQRRVDLVWRGNTSLSPAAKALVAEIRQVCTGQ